MRSGTDNLNGFGYPSAFCFFLFLKKRGCMYRVCNSKNGDCAMGGVQGVFFPPFS